jgi:transcriptional regulator with XRE-family HTH domain
MIIDEYIQLSKENYKLFENFTKVLKKEQEDKEKKTAALREKKKKTARKLRYLERKNLLRQIAALGYKQRDIAKIFKINEASVSNFLNGKRNVTPIYKERFLKIGIDLNEIMKDGEK